MQKTNLKTISPMTETEKAYLAGIIDGEGSLAIRRSVNPRAAHGYTFAPILSINNTDRALIYWCQAVLGLGYVVCKHPAKLHHKPVYVFQAACRHAAQIVEAVLPYLRIKRRQAEILLEMATASTVRTSWMCMTDEAFHKQLTQFEEMRLLNHRGTVVPRSPLPDQIIGRKRSGPLHLPGNGSA